MMRQREVRQGKLFEVNNCVHVPPLQKEVEQQAIRELVHLLRTLAKIIGAGADNEQDKR
jgi:hypothetical protein